VQILNRLELLQWVLSNTHGFATSRFNTDENPMIPMIEKTGSLLGSQGVCFNYFIWTPEETSSFLIK